MFRHLSGAICDRRRRVWGRPEETRTAGIGGVRVLRRGRRAPATRLHRRLNDHGAKARDVPFFSTGASFLATASRLTFVSRRRPNEEPSLPRVAGAFAESMRDVSNAERAGPIAEHAGSLTEMAGRVASLLDPMMELAGSIQKS